VTVLLFPAQGSHPVRAVKVPTTDAAAAAVEAEGRLLVELRRLRPAGVLATIPRVVDVVEFDGRPALVTTALPGIPMALAYRAWRHTAAPGRVRADFRAIQRWLARFQDGTASAPAPIDMAGA